MTAGSWFSACAPTPGDWEKAAAGRLGPNRSPGPLGWGTLIRPPFGFRAVMEKGFWPSLAGKLVSPAPRREAKRKSGETRKLAEQRQARLEREAKIRAEAAAKRKAEKAARVSA